MLTAPDSGAAKTGVRDLMRGGAVLGLAMIVANAGNYLLNVLLGRWLTPAEFSDSNLMVALMLTATALAVGVQLVAARYVGMYDSAGTPQEADRLAAALQRWAWIAGGVTGLVLIAPMAYWSDIFQTESGWPFVILGLGMPFYLAQAVGRGVLQGRLRFTGLAGTFIVEMVVRVGLGAGLVAAGFGVAGATVGLAGSFVATWIAVRVVGGLGGRHKGYAKLGVVTRYSGSVSILLVGQIITNNGDIFVAKYFLEPSDAGVYSAVALVGRAVFFLSWAVATIVFPAVLQRHAAGQESNGLMRGGIAAVVVIGAVCVIGAYTVGGRVVGAALGPAYGGLSDQLATYAIATVMFAVANLVASHHLSIGRTGESWLLLGGSLLQVVLLMLWHDSANLLIRAQLVAMGVLIVAMALSQIVRNSPRSIHPRGSHDGDRHVQGLSPVGD